jgi:hypothetical protein
MRALLIALVTWVCFPSAALTLEDVSPHFSPNTEIIWKVPTNDLPKRLWTYKKSRHVFSAVTISNAIVLAGFQKKGFPSGLMRTILWAEHMTGEPRPPNFCIWPENGTIQYDLADRSPNPLSDILRGPGEVEYAWDLLTRFSIDRNQFVKTNVAKYGVFFPRQIDGISFTGDTEGFGFQRFGKGKTLREFNIVLPNLHRVKEETTATPEEIIACIRAFKAPLAPNEDEAGYLGRVKDVAKTKKLTITKLAPYYFEGKYGEMPPDNEPPTIVMPAAALDAIATFETSNSPVRLFGPILSSEVKRVLKTPSGSRPLGGGNTRSGEATTTRIKD